MAYFYYITATWRFRVKVTGDKQQYRFQNIFETRIFKRTRIQTYILYAKIFVSSVTNKKLTTSDNIWSLNRTIASNGDCV